MKLKFHNINKGITLCTLHCQIYTISLTKKSFLLICGKIVNWKKFILFIYFIFWIRFIIIIIKLIFVLGFDFQMKFTFYILFVLGRILYVVILFLNVTFNWYFFTVTTQPTVQNPCNPTPCGPNSLCRAINGQAVCSCAPDYIGSPPNCRPECVVNNECQQNQACYKFKCTDPCPGTCGLGARCQVINHNPICSCPPGFTGDPFTRCTPLPRKSFFVIFHVYWSMKSLFLYLNVFLVFHLFIIQCVKLLIILMEVK